MTYQCWRCKADLQSPWQAYCRACGVVSPVDGKHNYELTRRRLKQACRNAPRFANRSVGGCLGAGGLTLIGLLVVFMSADSLDTSWLASATGVFFAVTLCVLLAICVCIMVGYGYASHTLVRDLHNACERQKAQMERIHPDFLPGQTLLRPADPLLSDRLVRPAEADTVRLVRPLEGNTTSDPALLLRTAEAEEQD